MKSNQLHIKLSAFSLLTVFLFTLLLNTLPHSHHSHLGNENAVKVSVMEHTHAEGHSHSHHSSEENGLNLLQNLEHPDHNFHVHNRIDLVYSKSDKIVNSVDLTFTTQLKSIPKVEEILSPNISYYFSDRNYLSLFSRNIPLRGPPRLV